MSEAEDRYLKSLAILESRGIPYLKNLPFIETVEQTTIRSPEDILKRMRCLIGVSRAAHAGNVDLARRDIQLWNLDDALTPDERRFVESFPISQRDSANFSWRIEAVVPLIWALGVHDDLYFPDQTADPPSLVEFVQGLTPEMTTQCNLRSPHDILDQADLIYRLHWATRQAHLKGFEAPGGLEPGVVQERHHALNWLISYCDEDWDEVTTDT